MEFSWELSLDPIAHMLSKPSILENRPVTSIKPEVCLKTGVGVFPRRKKTSICIRCIHIMSLIYIDMHGAYK